MRSRLFSLALPVVAFFALSTLPTHAIQVQNRITSAISNTSRVPLEHAVPIRAKRSTDLGAAPAGRALTNLSLRFNMTAAQQADLTQLLSDQLNPNSASYHQWLTPEQFGARFGMSASDISKVSNWLTSQGFKVTGTARSSTFITFTGSVAQAEKAFGTNIHTLSFNGETHFSNMTNPALPFAIANVVISVTGLNDFRAKPRSRFSKVKVNPNYTATGSAACATGSSTCYYIAPGDFYTIYDENSLLSNSINGSGITIAVMGQADLPTGAAKSFRSAAGLSTTNLPTTKTYGSDPIATQTENDVDESSLDIEWSGAVAPNASILFVNGPDVFTNALTQAIDNNLAPIITISYGICESQVDTNYSITGLNQLLEQANAEGITVISASGDSGATDCESPSDGLATEGLAVDFPGSSPYVTSAGGTMFSGDVNNASAYWNNSNTSNGTNQYTSSVQSYIPESAWNETNASTGLTAGGAGGGGASAYFSKPAWQTGTGYAQTPNDGARDVPDISLNSGAIHDGTIVCSQGDCTNGFADGTGFIDVFGGTSVAAPSFAGMLALVEQKQGGARLGNIGPNLYGLASVANVFHDIPSGSNNSVYCIQGTPNCSNGGPIGYNTGPGYDQATGLGSVDAANFVNDWSMGTPIGIGSGPSQECAITTNGGAYSTVCTTTTSLATTAALCGITSSLALTVSVSAVQGYPEHLASGPTGFVQFYVDNNPVGQAVALTNLTFTTATATYTLDTSALSSGGHNVSAVYLGDGNYSGSKGALLENSSNTGIISPIDVVSSSNDFSITPCTATTTVTTGTAATAIPLVITPTPGFTGTINLSANSDTGDVMGYAFSVKPVTITSSSGAVTTQFVLTATESDTAGKLKSPVGHHPASKAPWYAAGSGATLACLFLIAVPKRRRWGTLFALLLSVAIISASGCSSSSSNTGGSGGNGGGGGGTGLGYVSPGTYNITITATSGSLVHSVVLTYNVVQ